MTIAPERLPQLAVDTDRQRHRRLAERQRPALLQHHRKFALPRLHFPEFFALLRRRSRCRNGWRSRCRNGSPSADACSRFAARGDGCSRRRRSDQFGSRCCHESPPSFGAPARKKTGCGEADIYINSAKQRSQRSQRSQPKQINGLSVNATRSNQRSQRSHQRSHALTTQIKSRGCLVSTGAAFTKTSPAFTAFTKPTLAFTPRTAEGGRKPGFFACCERCERCERCFANF